MSAISQSAVIKATANDEVLEEVAEQFANALRGAGFNVSGTDTTFSVSGPAGQLKEFAGNAVVSANKKGDAINLSLTGQTSFSTSFWVFIGASFICCLPLMIVPILKSNKGDEVIKQAFEKAQQDIRQSL